MPFSRELHLAIIWSNASSQRDRILTDVAKRFSLHKVYCLTWSETHFASNMTRFYGQSLPDGSPKEAHCGRGPFTLALFTDERPRYDRRSTSKGERWVNVNVFDRKALYRQWSGGGHRIHATNDPGETSHNLILLLGKTCAEFSAANSQIWDGLTIEPIARDLEGANGWNSMRDLFRVLNHASQYVVLRNFENLPKLMDAHEDVDLLMLDGNGPYLANGRNLHPNLSYRVHYAVPIAGESVLFDFRTTSDMYMCMRFSLDVLDSRALSPRGFYRPSDELYFYSLLYHALVHKPAISDDYKHRLVTMSKDIGLSGVSLDLLSNTETATGLLDEFMDRNSYVYMRPLDKSVFFNSTIYKRDGLRTIRSRQS